MGSPLSWVAVMNQKYPEHKLELAIVQNTRNRQAENDLQNKDVKKDELSMKPLLVVTEEKKTKKKEDKERWR